MGHQVRPYQVVVKIEFKIKLGKYIFTDNKPSERKKIIRIVCCFIYFFFYSMHYFFNSRSNLPYRVIDGSTTQTVIHNIIDDCSNCLKHIIIIAEYIVPCSLVRYVVFTILQYYRVRYRNVVSVSHNFTIYTIYNHQKYLRPLTRDLSSFE